ncbi:unnamed protein product [Polarella glacialis]|uniref:Serine aminopeptidase S33 domain-containing protein n=1 Tax=Polarella glacialis TaxID=89957 RepID=A0A813E4Z4_POLGL|nr:unnamed protein product [Polarella glacialis]
MRELVANSEEAQEEGCAEQESSEDEEARVNGMAARQMPSYPFQPDFELEFDGSRIEVATHLCRGHPRETRAVAIFFPGVHGGVGPCRQPGSHFDEAALYATVARRLTESESACVDCYRCSWPHMRPRMNYAIGGACKVLHHGLLQAVGREEAGRSPSAGGREIRIIFLGHSLGGAVAVHSAKTVAGYLGSHSGTFQGLEQAVVRMAGLCTLNGAMDVCQFEGQSDALADLSSCKALLVSGDADEVVNPEATSSLFEALPGRDKRHLELPGGTHDLFVHKDLLVEELTQFILDCCA